MTSYIMDQAQKYVSSRVIMLQGILSHSMTCHFYGRLQQTDVHTRAQSGQNSPWLGCVACLELSASVYADNGASQAVHLPADGVSYKTVHHLLGHFHDGRLPKQFKSSIK